MKRKIVLLVAASVVVAAVWGTVRGEVEYNRLSKGCDYSLTDYYQHTNYTAECLNFAEHEGRIVGTAAFGLVFVASLALGALVIGITHWAGRRPAGTPPTRAVPPNRSY